MFVVIGDWRMILSSATSNAPGSAESRVGWHGYLVWRRATGRVAMTGRGRVPSSSLTTAPLPKRSPLTSAAISRTSDAPAWRTSAWWFMRSQRRREGCLHGI